MPFDPSQLKKRVFIVDDDLLLLSTIDRYLKRMGIQAYSFSSPKRAIRMLKNVQKTEDLILVTDVQMDEMDGYSLIREAKMISSSLMVIMMTALRKEVCEERMLQCGVQTCLEKPFPLSQLKKAIVES